MNLKKEKSALREEAMPELALDLILFALEILLQQPVSKKGIGKNHFIAGEIGRAHV